MDESHDQECELPGNFSGVAECEASSVQVEKNTIRSPTKDLHNTIETPYAGMPFESFEEAKKYYERYGVSKGFSTITRSSNKSWLHCDKVTNVCLACSHFGSHKKKLNENVERPHLNTSTQRGECKAHMFRKRKVAGKKTEDVPTGKHDQHLHPIEVAANKIKRKCRSCNTFADHDSRNCPQNPTSKRAKSNPPDLECEEEQ
ncbi:hypothetical protein IFM89_028426 [Coptis chinensis]|uniref:FAR1 domain-containing protein n=1 Tax=Coptis chinensis TaxID=261450 RepID=A0A835IUH9_9MAGN|nr:hypothetical protein IFM89_028426 [Coptis chinensis]